MLVKEVALAYPGQVEFADEEFGHSPMAERFGLEQYPVIFVDDILVAQPRDLSPGFGAVGGKYVPLTAKDKRDAFKKDVARVIDLQLAGKAREAHDLGETKMDANIARTLPNLSYTDLNGNAIMRSDLAGKAVVVEFWATWCPPCRTTLRWLEGMQAKFGEKVVIVAVAFDSPEKDVRAFVSDNAIHSRVVLGTPSIGAAFGNISSLPQVYVYDREGKLKDMILGAPPEGHERIEKGLTAALGG